MAKIVKTVLKLQIQAQQATPGQAIGPVLGQHGVNIQEFCKQFNEASKEMGSDIVPVELTVYEDRSFSMKLRTPPASDLLRKAAGIEKGSGIPNKNKVGKVTKDQARQIAERKMEDLNANDVEAAVKIVEGTARCMGITVEQ